MKQINFPYLIPSALLVGALALGGCKAKPAPTVDDASLTAAARAQLAGDSALSGQSLDPTVQNGVITLNGTVSNDTQKTLASRDVQGIAGIRTVVNNLTVASIPAPTATVTTATPVLPVPPVKSSAAVVQPIAPDRRDRDRDRRQQRSSNDLPAANNSPAPIERQQQAANNIPVAPPPPPAPAFRNVTVQTGTALPVRITQTLDSASTQTGQTFSGIVASDVLVDGLIAIPSGSAVSGQVTAVQEAAHFKGASLLTVALTSVRARGERLTVGTEPYTVQGKGRGTNTAEKVGGGAAVGAILGGILGGGKGAAIGAGVGGGAGAGVQGVTRGQQVQIASESIVRFRLSSPVDLRVRTDGGGPSRSGAGQPENSDPALQRRPPQ